MHTRRRLLNGETLVLDVPDAAALRTPTAIGVLDLSGLELEVTSGTTEDLEFYLSLSGTVLAADLTLRSGATIRYGRLGGDPQAGAAFAIPAGSFEVYGFTAPSMGIEDLAGYLADVAVIAGPDGPALGLSGPLTWSANRTHTVAQFVDLSEDEGYLLDIRRTRSGHVQEGRGLRVRGGQLSRSSPEERHAYAVLEAADFVSYGLSGHDGALDRVVASLAGVVTEVGT